MIVIDSSSLVSPVQLTTLPLILPAVDWCTSSANSTVDDMLLLLSTLAYNSISLLYLRIRGLASVS